MQMRQRGDGLEFLQGADCEAFSISHITFGVCLCRRIDMQRQTPNVIWEMENLLRRTKQTDLVGDAERDAAALAARVEASDSGDVPGQSAGADAGASRVRPATPAGGARRAAPSDSVPSGARLRALYRPLTSPTSVKRLLIS